MPARRTARSRPSQLPVTCADCGKTCQGSGGLLAHQRLTTCGKSLRAEALPPTEPVTPAVPEIDPHRYVSVTQRELLIGHERVARTGDFVNVMLVGPPGTGKGSLAAWHAATNRRPFFSVNAGMWQDATDSVGRVVLKSGETVFKLSHWLRIFETVPYAVILLDELNRVENPKALNVLYELLVEPHQTWVDEEEGGKGRLVQRAPGTMIFAAVNLDPADGGTERLATAQSDRWDRLWCDYPPLTEEVQILCRKTGVAEQRAAAIVNMATALRNLRPHSVPVSLRQTLRIARLSAHNPSFSLELAVEGTIADAFDEDHSRQVRNRILEVVRTLNPMRRVRT